jgi:putative transposase
MITLVVAVRQQLQMEGLDYGPLSVLARLRRLGITDAPSRATLARLFTQAGVVKAEPKKKPRSAYRRFVYPAPNCLWQIDATEWTLSTGVVCAIFQLIDDHSRLALASLVAASETAEAAVRVVKVAIGRHGVPQKFLSDNGLAFNPSRRGYIGQLVEYLHSLGVVAITGKPYKPTTQGKNERFHRTLHRFLNSRPPAATIEELQELVDEFDRIYNTEREHQALPGHMTPQEAWDATPVATPPTKPALPTAAEVLPAPPTMVVTAPGALVLLAEGNAKLTIPPGEAVRTVSSNGKTSVLNIKFKLGAYYAGQKVHVQWTHKNVDFFDASGTLIVSHPMPGKGVSYVGNGLTKYDALYRKKPENPASDIQPSTMP